MTKPKHNLELEERVDLKQFRAKMEALTGKQTQLVDTLVHYVEAVQYSLETDDFIAGQDVSLWAALDLFVDVVQYQTDMDKDVVLSEEQYKYVRMYLREGNDNDDLINMLIKHLSDSEIRDIVKTMTKKEN